MKDKTIEQVAEEIVAESFQILDIGALVRIIKDMEVGITTKLFRRWTLS